MYDNGNWTLGYEARKQRSQDLGTWVLEAPSICPLPGDRPGVGSASNSMQETVQRAGSSNSYNP